jgi:hypothetical protein
VGGCCAAAHRQILRELERLIEWETARKRPPVKMDFLDRCLAIRIGTAVQPVVAMALLFSQSNGWTDSVVGRFAPNVEARKELTSLGLGLGLWVLAHSKTSRTSVDRRSIAYMFLCRSLPNFPIPWLWYLLKSRLVSVSLSRSPISLSFAALLSNSPAIRLFFPHRPPILCLPLPTTRSSKPP